MPDATIAVDVLPAAPSGALRLGLKDAWFLVGWDAASGFDCQQSCQTQTYLVLARFWCNQAESGGAIVKKPRQLIECQRVPTPSLTKTDSTVLISLKTWDFLVPGDSDLHQKRARTK